MNSVGATFFVLFLELSGLPSTTAGICPYNITACNTYWGGIECTHLQEIPSIAVECNGTSVPALTFSDGNITTVNIHNLPPGLVKLKFTGHPLTNISDDAFSNSVATLNELSITWSDLRDLPRAILSLTNLRTLTIANTHIDAWDTGILQHLAKTLTSLQLQNVGLQKWPTWFSYFDSLTTADLSQNPFGSNIPNDAFNGTSNTLLKLIFNTCNFTHVPEALSTLMNLTAHYSIGNSINDQGVNALASFPLASTLQHILLDSIQLTRVPDFSNMTHLRGLSLGSNQISNSTTNVFPLFVTTLTLDSNSLTSVPADIAYMLNLSMLILAFNNITEVSFDMFPTHLDYPDLRRNKIIKITDAFSTKHSVLDTLFLNYNPIQEITPLAFTNLKSLRVLELKFTNLSELPLAISSLKRLSMLRMGHISSLVCSYPPPEELVKWFHSYQFGLDVSGDCNNGISIYQYLASWSSTTQVTTPESSHTTQVLTTPTTTKPSNAAALVAWLLCQHGCLLLLFSFYAHHI